MCSQSNILSPFTYFPFPTVLSLLIINTLFSIYLHAYFCLVCSLILNISFLYATYEWNHMYVFLWLILASCPQDPYMLSQMAKCHLFITESYYTVCMLYIYMCLCVYIYIHHIFFIHLSVDRHLGCFRILDTVRNAVMIGKWRCRYHFRLVFSYSLDKCPGVGKLDHMVVLFLIFWGIFIQSSSHCINLHFHQ